MKLQHELGGSVPNLNTLMLIPSPLAHCLNGVKLLSRYLQLKYQSGKRNNNCFDLAFSFLVESVKQTDFIQLSRIDRCKRRRAKAKRGRKAEEKKGGKLVKLR